MTVDHSYEESTMTDVSKEVLLELDNKKEELEEVRGELKKTERDLSELRIENTDQARNIKGLSTQLEEVQKSLSQYKVHYVELETNYVLSQSRIHDLEDQLLDYIFRDAKLSLPADSKLAYSEEDVLNALKLLPVEVSEADREKLRVCAVGLLSGMKSNSIECSKARVVLLEVVKKLELASIQTLGRFFLGLRLPIC
jgi:chromosome segregation ATPase